MVELVRGDDTGHGVVGKEAVVIDAVVIYPKAHAAARELSVDDGLPLHETVGELPTSCLDHGHPSKRVTTPVESA